MTKFMARAIMSGPTLKIRLKLTQTMLDKVMLEVDESGALDRMEEGYCSRHLTLMG
jgi:hypothetical protein